MREFYVIGDGANATRAEKFREDDDRVDRREEQIAHEPNVITPASLHKTARQGPFGLEFGSSPPAGFSPPGMKGKCTHLPGA